jgi:hypothetical protein
MNQNDCVTAAAVSPTTPRTGSAGSRRSAWDRPEAANDSLVKRTTTIVHDPPVNIVNEVTDPLGTLPQLRRNQMTGKRHHLAA